MQNRREKKALWRCLAALSAISVLRQVWRHVGEMQFTPAEATIIFFVYTALLNVWWYSIQTRVAQKAVRRFLTVGHWLTVSWFLVILLQNGIKAGQEQYGRFGGYLLAIPVIYGFQMNFYASLLLGKADDAKLDRRWYLLLIPASLIVAGYLTNQYHFFMNTEVPVPAGPSNHYRVNVGSVLAALWIIAMELLKIFNIMRSGRSIQKRWRKWLPLLELMLLILYTIPYIAIDFTPPKLEFIEYTAGLFCYEILVWESCILIGVLPVNTDYNEIFHRSDIGMQLLFPNGEVFLQSENAIAVDAERFEQLKQKGTATASSGLTLNLAQIKGGYVVFHSDTREIEQLAGELQERKASLEEESEILRTDLANQKEIRHIREQRRLYGMVYEQTEEERQEIVRILSAMRQALAYTPDARASSDEVRNLLEQFCASALCIKNRGNRILEQEYQSEAEHEA